MIARHMARSLRATARQSPIVTVTGPRQSGKTCPLSQSHLCAAWAPRHDGGMSTRDDRRDRWRKIIGRQQASGLSALAFCRRAGVPQSSFFAWRRKLRDEATFAEVKLPPVTRREPSGIELRLPGGCCIVVRPGFDRQTLLDLLHILETSSSDLRTQEAGA